MTLAILAALAGCGGGGQAGSDALAPRQLALTSSTATAATFAGKRADYSVTRSGAGFAIRENTNGATSTVTASVQSLNFDDISVNLTMAEKAASISAADLKLLIELYVAFFNRVPEADGLAYWIVERSLGKSIDTIAESFYAAAITPGNSLLTGYSSSMSPGEFVSFVYRNVLGRSSVDPDGMSYWSASLTSGAETHGSLVRTILASAHTFKGQATLGYVADLLDNKSIVGNALAIQQGLNYLPAESSYLKTVAVAARVTPTDTATAINSAAAGDSAFNLPAMSASVSLVNNTTLMFRRPATFTISGQNLDGAISIVAPACSGVTETGTATATNRSFSCTPTAVGPLALTVLRTRDNATLLSMAPVVPAPQVTMRTNMGDMVIELYPANAPLTVDNFLQYASDGFYAGTIFHRVISNFVIQGGGFNTQLTQLTTRAPIKLEAANGLSNLRGTVAMARTSVRDSATSQFFINVVDNTSLNASAGNDGYAVFGKVVGGMAVADAIKGVPVVNYGSFQSIPYTFVIISSVTQTQ